ncbi:hypothetical protein BY996DRAFT_6412436 [Phakopsora pachyrhizi]|nr:hypothetical protein BY996DRAFT_6412436 [Phakopsora pachyrhizi]
MALVEAHATNTSACKNEPENATSNAQSVLQVYRWCLTVHGPYSTEINTSPWTDRVISSKEGSGLLLGAGGLIVEKGPELELARSNVSEELDTAKSEPNQSWNPSAEAKDWKRQDSTEPSVEK